MVTDAIETVVERALAVKFGNQWPTMSPQSKGEHRYAMTTALVDLKRAGVIEIKGDAAPAVEATTLQITGKTFCAAIVAKGGVVVETAPILKKLKGLTGQQVVALCKSRGWTYAKVDHAEGR